MWIMPTMSRPKQCRDVLERIQETGCSTRGMVFLNGHKSHHQYFSGVLPFVRSGWNYFPSEKNLGCIGALNKVFELYPNEPFYGFIGDDEFLMDGTPSNWDQLLIEATGDWNVSHGWDDLHQGKRAQGYLCIGGKLARAIGYLAIPETWHWFGLDCMYEWLSGAPALGGGGACKNILVPEVRVHHKHAYAARAPMDDCYRLGESKSEEDKNIFWHWITHRMPEICARIKKLKEEECEKNTSS